VQAPAKTSSFTFSSLSAILLHKEKLNTMKISFAKAGKQPIASAKSLTLVAIAGIIFITSSLFAYNLNRIDSDWVKTQGTVIEAVRYGRVNKTQWTLTVETTGSSISDPKIGDKQEIAYNVNHPEQSKLIDDGIFEKVSALLLLLLGLGALSFAFWQIYKKNKTFHS
jgi:hypothetical protein